MKNTKTLFVALFVLLVTVPAFVVAQDEGSLFDVDLGGAPAIIVTPEQLVDGIIGQWSPHGFYPRYVDREGGIVIGEAPWFMLTSRYRVKRIPPNNIIEFPDYFEMKRVALLPQVFPDDDDVPEEKRVSKKEKKKLRQEAAKAILAFHAVEVLRQRIEEQARSSRRGRRNIDFVITSLNIERLQEQLSDDDAGDADVSDADAGDADVEEELSDEDIAKAMKFDWVPWNGQRWYTCEWANKPRPNETKANSHFDPKRPPSCLIKIAFTGTEKRKPIMAITLASLQDIPHVLFVSDKADSKGEKAIVGGIPGGVGFLMGEYGFTKEDAIRFSKVAPMVLNTSTKREGLLDTFRKLEDAQTDPATSRVELWTVLYAVGWFIVMILLAWTWFKALETIVYNIWRTTQWSWKIWVFLYCPLLLIAGILMPFYPFLEWVFLGVAALLLIIPSLISSSNGEGAGSQEPANAE
jgi:hypothetical protein